MVFLSSVILIAFAVIFIYWCQRIRYRVRENAWRPSALKNAKLIYAEKVFSTWTPFPLVAKVDRGYLVGNMIVLAELKTRRIATVYQSDIIELSAQRVAIEAATGRCVAKTAYVVIQYAGRRDRMVLEVPLLSVVQVISLARRLEDLRARRASPTKTDHKRLCAQCAFVRECRPE